MSLIALDISIQEDLEDKLRAIQELGENPRDILDEGAAMLLNHIRDRFLRETDTDGQPWAPLNPDYAKRKEARYHGGGILYASGKLWQSIQEFAGAGDENSRVIGTDAANSKGVMYGQFHQYGTVKMPKREFMGIPGEDVDLLTNMVIRRISEAISHG